VTLNGVVAGIIGHFPVATALCAMTQDEKQLLELFRGLDEAARGSLLDFAGYLAQRADNSHVEPLPEPSLLPRPEQESVVSAIKRLSSSYPMLDRSKMLHETSHLMAQHLMQGRDASEVIDELEVVFHRHYRRLVEQD